MSSTSTRAYIRACRPSPTHPLPREGKVFFYLLTANEACRAECNESDLAQRRDPLSNLNDNCHVVMTLVGQIEQSRGFGA